MKFYKCNICGNLVELIHNGKGKLVCCGEFMEELNAQTEDEGREKHVPVVEKDKENITVKVGSVLHPMIKEHYIEWIIIVYNNKVMRANLNHDNEPTATFVVKEDFEEMEIYEYCNIHGLWKSNYKK